MVVRLHLTLQKKYTNGVFIWSWNPILTAIFILLIDFGAVYFLGTVFHNDERVYKFRSYWIGDTLLLPTIAFFSSFSLSKVNINATYLTNPFWIILIIILGYTTILVSEILSVRNKRHAAADYHEPAWIYHILISGPMFYFIIGPLPLIFSQPGNRLAESIIAFCLIFFVILIYTDFLSPFKQEKRA